MRRVAARLITTALISAFAVLVSDGVAWAHAGGLTSSSNEPVVIGIQPPVPGLTVTAVEAGARLRLDNRTGQRIAVVPPAGTVINALPLVDPGDDALWSDPRIVAASTTPRPPGARLDWRIPLRVGDLPVSLVGEQRWPPPPNAGLWWLITAVSLAVPVGLVALGSRPSDRPLTKSPTRADKIPDSRGTRGGVSAVSRWTLAVATAVVMGAHVVHMYGSALVVAQGTLIWVFLAAAGFAVVGWPIGAAGAWLTARGRPAGPLLCLVAGALLAIIIAPADVFSFHDAVIPFAWGPDLDRLLIALTVGGGLGVVAAAWLLMRRTPATGSAVPPATEASGGQS
ncbi:MAG: hypothetical protein QOI75_2261 [Pseudonocardiales bacterium]|nr:hypothetical protein [Pseudonocardiales bacterium]